MQKKGLGRGLGALIPFESREEEAATGKGTMEIPVREISVGRFQPRKTFPAESMRELVQSIKEKGVLQPVIVQKGEKGYDLVAGERRWRATRMAGLKKIPAIVMNLSDMETLEVALIENIHRQDLNPIEEATVYQRLGAEFDLTQEAISRRVGRDRSSVANSLRLLKLPPEIKEDIAEGRMSMGHARAMLPLDNPREQMRIRGLVLKNQWSVREVENRIKHLRSGPAKRTRKRKDVHLNSVEENLKKMLGARVSIVTGKKGGKIVIPYHSDEELDRILQLLEKT